MKGINLTATKRIPNNKITKRYNFIPTILAKLQSVTCPNVN